MTYQVRYSSRHGHVQRAPGWWWTWTRWKWTMNIGFGAHAAGTWWKMNNEHRIRSPRGWCRGEKRWDVIRVHITACGSVSYVLVEQHSCVRTAVTGLFMQQYSYCSTKFVSKLSDHVYINLTQTCPLSSPLSFLFSEHHHPARVPAPHSGVHFSSLASSRKIC